MTVTMERPSPPQAAGPPARSTGGVRVEIQALRALAMLLVVVYHVVPTRLTGGFVGVDVFFVVSGFLITSHLMKEVDRTGRIRLAQFWARRARRLLPAALLVLLASAVATFAFVPQTNWQSFLREIGASALYVENWLLAADAVDYLAADNIASPAQHYWSLSTEEQFYIVWPLLILGSVWLSARFTARPRIAVAGVLGAVVATSFAWSWWATTHASSLAYFATPARAWEFGLGGLLALASATPSETRNSLRSIVSWAGFVAIGWSAFAYSSATAFPGTAALVPVLGTLAVIWAGAPRGAWSSARIAEFGPTGFLGDVSYSAYLWHWPVIVVLPYALGHELGTTSKVGVLVLTIALAWATKSMVEDPLRDGRRLGLRRPRPTFIATVVSTGLVVATATAGWFHVQTQVDQARAAAASFAGAGDPCFGAGAMDPARMCESPFAVTEAVNTTFAKSDLSEGMGCLVAGSSSAVRGCRHDTPGSTRTIALIGDSHAASWWEAVTAVADDQGWSAVLHVHTGCPALATDRFTGPTMPEDQPRACQEWGERVIRTVAADPAITTVLTSYRSDIYKYRAPDGGLLNRIPAEVVQAALQPLVDAGKRVEVLRAVPSTNGVTPDGVLSSLETPIPDCVARSPQQDDPCAGPREVRLTPDYIAEGVQGMPGAGVIDLSDQFCDAQSCHSVIGGSVVYWDGSHLTATFSRSLAPFLLRALHEDGN